MKKFDSLSAKLSLENKLNVESTSEFDEDSDMSEISVHDEVDCSEFVKNEPQPAKALISENLVEFARISQNKPKNFKRKSNSFSKGTNYAQSCFLK